MGRRYINEKRMDTMREIEEGNDGRGTNHTGHIQEKSYGRTRKKG